MSGSTEFTKYRQRGAYHWVGHESARLELYEPETEARYLVALRLVARELGSLRGRRVLDVGCGDGVLLALARRGGARVVGLDAEQAGLQLARQELGRRGVAIGLVRGVCETLPFRSGSADAVVAVEVIEHLPDPESLLSESHRVLRDNGVLVVTTPRRLERGPPRSRFHVQEFNRRELAVVLMRHFPRSQVVGFCHPWALRWLYGVPGLRAGSHALFKRLSRAISNPCAWLVVGAAADRCDSLAAVAWRR